MPSNLPLTFSVDSVPKNKHRQWWDDHRNVAIVHVAADGSYTVSTRATPTIWEKVLNWGGTRLAVDVGDHRRQAAMVSTPLPCSDQAHRFEARLDVGFRVHDPEEVVRRNIPDALPIIYGHITHLVRTTVRRFAIDEADRAEAEINRAFLQPVRLPEGLTIYLCRVHIEPDEEARKYIEALARYRRESELGQREHDKRMAQAASDEAVEDAGLNASLARDKLRAEALSRTGWDIDGLIMQHLTKHPDDTEGAARLRLEWEATQAARWALGNQRHDEMLKFMVEKDLFRAPDLMSLLGGQASGALQSLGLQAAPPPALGPAPTAPVMWGGPAAGTAAGPSSAPAATGATMPVYVVLDASQSAAPFTAGLNDALRSLHTALTQSPDVAAGVRLSVIGYADRPDMRLPLTRVEWGTDVPHLSAGGELHLTAAFEGLVDLLPGDVDQLKRAGGRVHRPVVFLVTTAPPQDHARWPDAQQILGAHRYAPTVVACGLGSAEARTVLRIASSPELAFVAAPGVPVPDQAAQFSVLLQNTLLHLGRGVVAGRPDLVTECPAGLIPARSAG
ncbi:vWA domain-containing protein [Streptomyces sp. NPDC001770]